MNDDTFRTAMLVVGNLCIIGAAVVLVVEDVPSYAHALYWAIIGIYILPDG